MLRCITEGNETLYASSCEEESTRKLSRAKSLYCPNCRVNVIFRKGKIMSAHFAHRDSDCIVNHSEPETNSHIKGKEVLYNWLTKKYPTAFVEYEYPITETGQIADVFLEHKEGDLKGIRWAFEFQHSPLSSTDWEVRYNLYKSAGIQSFWILDKAKYLKFSTAKGHTDARKRNDLEKNIYREVGLCYFLDLEKEEITIDFNFETHSESNIFNRKRVITDYTYHRPQDHAAHINKIRIRLNDEFKYAVLLYDEIEGEMESRLGSILGKLQREKEARLEEELQLRIPEVKDFADTIYEEAEADIARRFISDNERDLAEDIRNLSNKELFDKYEEFIKKAKTNKQSLKVLEESTNIKHKYITDKFWSWDIYKLSFLVAQATVSLEDYLLEKYKDKVFLIEYAYNTYKDVFEKLSSRNTELLNNDLRKIKPFLQTYQKNPTAMDYAIKYDGCKSTEEIDKYVEQVVEEIINYDPFADWEW